MFFRGLDDSLFSSAKVGLWGLQPLGQSDLFAFEKVLWGTWLSPPKRFLTKGLLWRAFPTAANELLSTGGSNTFVYQISGSFSKLVSEETGLKP